MLPGDSFYDAINALLGDSKARCNRGHGLSGFLTKSYFFHILIAKLGRVMFFAAGCSSLCISIFCVFHACSQEKMVGTHTSRIIAGVQDPHSFWDFSKVYLPGKSVSPDIRTGPDIGIEKINSPIPILVLESGPVPTTAFTQNINLFPKPFIKRLGCFHIVSV